MTELAGHVDGRRNAEAGREGEALEQLLCQRGPFAGAAPPRVVFASRGGFGCVIFVAPARETEPSPARSGELSPARHASSAKRGQVDTEGLQHDDAEVAGFVEDAEEQVLGPDGAGRFDELVRPADDPAEARRHVLGDVPS